MTSSPYCLGATLYMPATRHDILPVARGDKFPRLQSMAICLEDSVAAKQIDLALSNLITITNELAEKSSKSKPPIVFIRPRNIEMAKDIVNNYDLTGIDGLIFPKFTLENLRAWENITHETDLICMPTLETKEVFDVRSMQALADALVKSKILDKIIALRIGGNDLMNVLGIRRSKAATIYDGPLSYVIKMLTCTFGAAGLSLTSPVFELINNPELLVQELQQDLLHGLVGKTAIHPDQIQHIQDAFMVDPLEYEDAIGIINTDQAVYQHAGAMCEPATHQKWAKNILERSKHFGLKRAQNMAVSLPV